MRLRLFSPHATAAERRRLAVERRQLKKDHRGGLLLASCALLLLASSAALVAAGLRGGGELRAAAAPAQRRQLRANSSACPVKLNFSGHDANAEPANACDDVTAGSGCYMRCKFGFVPAAGHGMKFSCVAGGWVLNDDMPLKCEEWAVTTLLLDLFLIVVLFVGIGALSSRPLPAVSYQQPPPHQRSAAHPSTLNTAATANLSALPLARSHHLRRLL